VAADDTLATVQKDSPAFLVPFAALLGNDADADLDPLTVVSVGQTVGGTATLQADGILFTPADGFSGAASFQYTISDGRGATSAANASFTINSAPMVSDAWVETNEDTPVSGTIAASDANGDTLSFALKDGAGPTSGGVQLDGASGAWTYTPNHDVNGGDSF